MYPSLEQNMNESKGASNTQFAYDVVGSPVSKPQSANIPVAQPYYENASTVNASRPFLEQANTPLDLTFQAPGYSNCTTVKYTIYHIINSILGIAAFVLITTLVSLSFSLIPLFGFGIFLWRFMLDIQRFLVEVDVALFNYMMNDSNLYIRSCIPHTDGMGGLSKDRFAYGLFYCSRRSIIATLYFLTVKFAAGVLSLVSVAFFVAGPCLLVGTIVFEDWDDTLTMFGLHFRSNTVEYVLCFVGTWILSLAAMYVTGPFSLLATKFFCASENNPTPANHTNSVV